MVGEVPVPVCQANASWPNGPKCIDPSLQQPIRTFPMPSGALMVLARLGQTTMAMFVSSNETGFD